MNNLSGRAKQQEPPLRWLFYLAQLAGMRTRWFENEEASFSAG